MNSCRITHIKTGVISTAQTRSRENSFKLAKDDILNKLNNFHIQSENEIISSDRKHQVGSGMRGDKVRTIRFQDDTMTDHITGKKTTATKFMKGYMDLLWE
jgi:peptide chain release factor 1